MSSSGINGSRRTISAQPARNQSETFNIDGDTSDKARAKRKMATCSEKAFEQLALDLDTGDYKAFRDLVSADATGICMVDPASSEVERSDLWRNHEGLTSIGISKEALLDKAMSLIETAKERITWFLQQPPPCPRLLMIISPSRPLSKVL